jgi:integrase
MADAGVPITTIQRILGHQKARTTDTYLRNIKASFDKGVNPLEVIK